MLSGLVFSRTDHWSFDRGILAVDEDYRILESPDRLPDRFNPLLRPDRTIGLPDREPEWPAKACETDIHLRKG